MTDLIRVDRFTCNHFITLTGYGHVWNRTYAVCPNCHQIVFMTWKDTRARVVNRLLLWAPGVAFLAGLAFVVAWDLFGPH